MEEINLDSEESSTEEEYKILNEVRGHGDNQNSSQLQLVETEEISVQREVSFRNPCFCGHFTERSACKFGSLIDLVVTLFILVLFLYDLFLTIFSSQKGKVKINEALYSMGIFGMGLEVIGSGALIYATIDTTPPKRAKRICTTWKLVSGLCLTILVIFAILALIGYTSGPNAVLIGCLCLGWVPLNLVVSWFVWVFEKWIEIEHFGGPHNYRKHHRHFSDPIVMY